MHEFLLASILMASLPVSSTDLLPSRISCKKHLNLAQRVCTEAAGETVKISHPPQIPDDVDVFYEFLW